MQYCLPNVDLPHIALLERNRDHNDTVSTVRHFNPFCFDTFTEAERLQVSKSDISALVSFSTILLYTTRPTHVLEALASHDKPFSINFDLYVRP